MQALDATKRVFGRATADGGGGTAAPAGPVLCAGPVFSRRAAGGAAVGAAAAVRRGLVRPRLLPPPPARSLLHTLAANTSVFHLHLRVDTEETYGKTDSEGTECIDRYDPLLVGSTFIF